MPTLANILDYKIKMLPILPIMNKKKKILFDANIG